MALSHTIQSNLFNAPTKRKTNRLEYDDYKPPVNLKTNIKYGDLFQLGEHRLMCGDSLNKMMLMDLMDNERADITFTSPPYNTHSPSVHIGFHHGGNVLTDENQYYNSEKSVYLDNGDDLTHEEYSDFLCISLQNALSVSDDVLFNIGILAGSKIGLTKLLYEYRNNLCDVLVWEKNSALPLGLPSQAPMVSHRAELIFCFNQDGTRKFSHSQWSKGTMDNIIITNKMSSNNYSNYNNATFPLEFAYSILKDFTEDSVLDIFGGTGTTLIASEHLKRKCYMMELNPLYCQLIINRWEHYTGLKSKQLN